MVRGTVKCTVDRGFPNVAVLDCRRLNLQGVVECQHARLEGQCVVHDMRNGSHRSGGLSTGIV